MIGTAVKVMRIATGEIEEDIDPKAAAAAQRRQNSAAVVEKPARRRCPPSDAKKSPGRPQSSAGRSIENNPPESRRPIHS
jgi:hypothetical protein